jgi:1-acyl-sn-glycerol-3-phosphate acyltransferase
VVLDSLIWLVSRMTMPPLLHAPPLRLRRSGTEHLPREGALLLVSNHVSVADPIVLMAAARPRRTAMMAKSELFRIRMPAWDTQLFRGPARVVFGPPIDMSRTLPWARPLPRGGA